MSMVETGGAGDRSSLGTEDLARGRRAPSLMVAAGQSRARGVGRVCASGAAGDAVFTWSSGSPGRASLLLWMLGEGREKQHPAPALEHLLVLD